MASELHPLRFELQIWQWAPQQTHEASSLEIQTGNFAVGYSIGTQKPDIQMRIFLTRDSSFFNTFIFEWKKSKPVGSTRTQYSQTGKNMKWAETFVWCLLFIFKVVYWDHLTVISRRMGFRGERAVAGLGPSGLKRIKFFLFCFVKKMKTKTAAILLCSKIQHTYKTKQKTKMLLLLFFICKKLMPKCMHMHHLLPLETFTNYSWSSNTWIQQACVIKVKLGSFFIQQTPYFCHWFL